MLVLTRQRDESIVIGEGIVITVLEIRGDKVRIGIEAPRDLPVHRLEIFQRVREEQVDSGKDVAPLGAAVRRAVNIREGRKS